MVRGTRLSFGAMAVSAFQVQVETVEVSTNAATTGGGKASYSTKVSLANRATAGIAASVGAGAANATTSATAGNPWALVVGSGSVRTQCRPVRACRGMQTSTFGFNVCFDPPCDTYFFMSTDDDTKKCYLAPGFYVIIAIVVAAFIFAELGWLCCFERLSRNVHSDSIVIGIPHRSSLASAAAIADGAAPPQQQQYGNGGGNGGGSNAASSSFPHVGLNDPIHNLADALRAVDSNPRAQQQAGSARSAASGSSSSSSASSFAAAASAGGAGAGAIPGQRRGGRQRLANADSNSISQQQQQSEAAMLQQRYQQQQQREQPQQQQQRHSANGEESARAAANFGAERARMAASEAAAYNEHWNNMT